MLQTVEETNNNVLHLAPNIPNIDLRTMLLIHEKNKHIILEKNKLGLTAYNVRNK